MTQKEVIQAFKNDLKVDLRCYHGVFLNYKIVALTYKKDLRGNIYVIADLKRENDKKSVVTAGIENCSFAKGENETNGKA